MVIFRKKSHQIALRMTEKEHELAHELADRYDLTISGYLRGLLLYSFYREKRPEVLEFDRPGWLLRHFPEILETEKEILEATSCRKQRGQRKGKRGQGEGTL
jgi:hypothetical protein